MANQAEATIKVESHLERVVDNEYNAWRRIKLQPEIRSHEQPLAFVIINQLTKRTGLDNSIYFYQVPIAFLEILKVKSIPFSLI